MTLSVNAYDLKVALTRLRPAVAGLGGSLPILACVRTEPIGRNRLVLTASDLELTITTTITCEAKKGPAMVFPYGQLAAVVSSVRKPTKKNLLPTRLTLTPDGDRITVEMGPRRLSLVPLPASEFPRCIPTDLTEGPVTVPAEAFSEVAEFASKDCARPILACVMLGEGNLVATDSYRLGLRSDLPVTPGEVLIPAAAARVVGRLGGNPVLTWSDRTAGFVWPDVAVYTRLCDGKFPNYKGLIPADLPPNQVTFLDPDLTVSALGALARLTNQIIPVKFTADTTGTTILSVDNGDIRDQFTVPTTYSGAEVTTGFNPKYLASVLGGIDKPTLSLTNEQRVASVIDGPRTRIIMPVRIS